MVSPHSFTTNSLIFIDSQWTSFFLLTVLSPCICQRDRVVQWMDSEATGPVGLKPSSRAKGGSRAVRINNRPGEETVLNTTSNSPVEVTVMLCWPYSPGLFISAAQSTSDTSISSWQGGGQGKGAGTLGKTVLITTLSCTKATEIKSKPTASPAYETGHTTG